MLSGKGVASEGRCETHRWDSEVWEGLGLGFLVFGQMPPGAPAGAGRELHPQPWVNRASEAFPQAAPVAQSQAFLFLLNPGQEVGGWWKAEGARDQAAPWVLQGLVPHVLGSPTSTLHTYRPTDQS